MDVPPGEITRLLADLRQGDKDAESRLVPLIYGELRHIAQQYMRRERPDHTLQPTALVNEVYLKLIGQQINWQNRAHFFAVAAKLMRRILVDYARAHRAVKRGGEAHKVDIEDIPSLAGPHPEKMLALDQALSRLEEWDATQCRIVELRFFGGLTEEETAEVLELSPRTIKREWSLAKAWLYGEIGK